MDEHRFDHWVRRFGQGVLPRRRVVPLLAAGLGALSGLLTRQPAMAAPCPKGKQRCGKRCIPKRHCCTDADCRPRGRGQVCRRGRCCFGTAGALRRALKPGGPAVIRLCPQTTYRGRFAIKRNVTVIGAGAHSTILKGVGGASGDAWGGSVVTVTDEVTAATLRGVQITNGRARSGGALHNQGVLVLSRCRVARNRSQYDGGGIANGGTMTLTASTVTENSAHQGWGGGITNWGTLRLSACAVTNNRALSIRGLGGGINNWGGGTTLATRCAVTGNLASIYGGGFDNWGTLTLKDCTVADNRVDGERITTSRGGGGIRNSSGTVTLEGTTRVVGNRSVTRGGGILNDASFQAAARLVLRGASLVADNDADPANPESGGGIFNNLGVDGLQVPGIVEFFDTSRVTGNRPNNCTGTTACPG